MPGRFSAISEGWGLYAEHGGQACSYMMGQLKLIELREHAKQALGDRFSLRQSRHGK